MSRYVSITQARAAPGLRMACLRGVPSPWTEAAKGIFHVKGLACQYAAQSKEDPAGALVACSTGSRRDGLRPDHCALGRLRLGQPGALLCSCDVA